MICSFKKLIYPKSMVEAQSGGYMIAVYRLYEKVPDIKGYPVSEAKVVGYYLPMAPGIRVNMHGHWTKNAKYGNQFEAESFEEIIQPSRDGVIAYLSSGLIKGIGPRTAERIYDTFGGKTLDILDSCPNELMKVSGISQKKLNRICESYLVSRTARDVVAYLAPYGVSPNRAVRIFKEYGRDAINIVRRHPYQLCDMAGIGFKTADEIARNMGLSPASSERIAAGLVFTLKEAENKGHLCLEKRTFIKQTMKLLNTDGLTARQAATEAYQLLQHGKLVLYEDRVYRDVTAKAEQCVAVRIQELLGFGSIGYTCDLDTEIAHEENRLKLLFADEQRKAIKTCLTSHICITTGGPGTGKTLIQRILLNIYRREHPDAKIICCAPTGRAARRMEQCTGYPASTIHKALGLLAGDDGEYNTPETLDADLVLVDEVSMLDIYLARHLFNSIPYGCQVILIGDADQLPSVGPGAVLSELIDSRAIPVVKLDRVYRQNAGSRIAINASLIRHDTLSLEYGDDFVFCESSGFRNSADIIENLYLKEIRKFGVDNVALLTPYRKKTETGVYALNTRLREKVNPPSPDKPEVTVGRRLFRLGDKVMQIRNRDDINNGDIGYITYISRLDEISVHVDFGDGRSAQYDVAELDLLELAYASTIHKSQGSEYLSVLINLQSAHYIMLKRPLIYTAITRAKQCVMIIGERKALCMAIRKVDTEQRGTMLAGRINECIDTKSSNI